MPMELKQGVKVPIPCRHCAQSMIPFEIREGTHPLPCPRCGLTIQVEVFRHEGQLRVRTATVGAAGHPPTGRS